SSLSWMTAVFFLPEIGLLLYLLICRSTLPPWRLDRLKLLPGVLAPVRQRLARHPSITHPQIEPELEPAVKPATNLGHFPILAGNAVEVLTDYNGTIDRLVADIDSARDHVHLLYYIFTNDACASMVSSALDRAVKRGVVCRVLVDAFGSKSHLKALLPLL